MIVEVKQGKLEGFIKKSILTGYEYGCFLGIPYAQPPVGELRFKPPQPLEKWEGTLKAFKEGSPCVQKDSVSGKFVGSEDCLYLNVYIPTTTIKNAAKKAVMVFFHGGGFAGGSGSRELFSADYLVNYDIILVTLNYRLHVLGFLDTGAKNYKGNCGLRDQNLALKWIKENIEQFGGDAENITIFGESSGGLSVYFHLLSPLSKGLFHKAIIQSDPTLGIFKNGSNDKKLGSYLAKKLNYEETDREKLVQFYKEKSAEELCTQAASIFGEVMKRQDEADLEDVFGPSLEFHREDAFIPDNVENLMKVATPIPLMIGMTNKEGRLAIPLLEKYLMEELKNDFTKVIKRPTSMDSKKLQSVCNQAKKHYLGDKPVGEETVDNIIDLFTDHWFRKFYHYIDFVINSEAAVYIYEFCFHGKFNVYEKMTSKDRFVSNEGACHGDELPYLFYPQKLLPELKEFTEPEKSVIQNMCSLWTNFAKYGNPSENFKQIDWKRFMSTKPCYLRIDKDLKLVEEKLREKQFEFWEKLLE